MCVCFKDCTVIGLLNGEGKGTGVVRFLRPLVK
jgi:hypothetical protein